jgi:general secretion pathway protein A
VLQRFLTERTRAGQTVVLIFDEAHHLDPATLEHIRLLSNFESSSQKRLQILLIGQPELKAKLALPELRQLQQRITLRAVVPRLSRHETRQYIRGRLRIAGASVDIFTERAVSRIAAYAGGIPRIVNTVCEHCLLIGYQDQKRRLDVDVVQRAVRYLDNGAAPRNSRSGTTWRRWLSRRRVALAAFTPVLLSLMVSFPAVRREAVGMSHFIAPFFATVARSMQELFGR